MPHASSPNGFTPGGAALALGLAPSNGFDVPFVASTCDAHGSPTGAAGSVSPNGLANGLGAADDGGDGDAHGAAAGGGVIGRTGGGGWSSYPWTTR